MPFKSEKQRRFLWAAHPDIAKRWAHEYPTKKKLPMYANKDKTDDKKETTHKQSTVNPSATNIYAKLFKKSDAKEVYIEQPSSDKPTVAGENPPKVIKTKNENCGCEKTPKNTKNSIMAKLSAVLSQPVMQALENEKAEIEAREAQRQPANVGLNIYNTPATGIPLPMGMQPQAPQAQPQAPAAQPANTGSPAPSGQLPPVGGGSSPNANPINSYGALSSTGDITGNAAFGTTNSAGGEKMSKQLGLWDRIRAKRERGEKPAKPGDKDYPDAKNWKKVTSISEKKSAQAQFADALMALVYKYAEQKCSCGCGDTSATCKCPNSCSCKQKGGSCYKAEKSAGTPAWQRAAGKNPEGGLNEKGRKSYERETGGNLKAPVTEKNPKGEAKKRRHSFCSRMCGMKRVNTGAKTKSDPDSRINKSLRKWNCKCSSAMEFGAKLASALIAK